MHSFSGPRACAGLDGEAVFACPEAHTRAVRHRKSVGHHRPPRHSNDAVDSSVRKALDGAAYSGSGRAAKRGQARRARELEFFNVSRVVGNSVLRVDDCRTLSASSQPTS